MTYTLKNLTINTHRLYEDFEALAEIGATVDGGVSRLALSNEDLEARAWLADQFEAAGLMVRDDDAGNLSGVLPSQTPDAKTLLIGCHMDSVPNGGRYDSSVSVLSALECLRTIKEAGIELPVHLEAINFTDEEGCWQSLFGSRAITGSLDDSYIDDKSVDYGPFRAALFRAGIRPADINKARRDPATLAGFIQLEVEQGSTLDREGYDIGIVTGIVGRATYRVTFYGEASHSGTTATADRRDALLGATDYIQKAYAQVSDVFPRGIFNCGNLRVSPGAFNIVPDEAQLLIECRHPDERLMSDMESWLIRLSQDTAIAHKLSVGVHRLIRMPAVQTDPHICGLVEHVCEQIGVKYMHLTSYTGHDAQIMSTFTPSGMIFLPSVGGISHSPKEFTQWHHVETGTLVLLRTILMMARQAHVQLNGKT